MTQKILIVDDQPLLRELICQSLEELQSAGVELMTASDGREALDIIQSALPDLVFMDVMMPTMNGFTVCQTVKQ